MYKISLLITLTLCTHYAHAMMFQGMQYTQPTPPPVVQVQTNGYIVRVPKQDLKSIKHTGGDIDYVKDPRTNLDCCKALQRKAPHPVVTAAQQGDLAAVQAYFNSWAVFFSAQDHYDKSVAFLLDHVTQFPAETTGSVAQLLLKKVNFNALEHPDCLIKYALKNGHVPVLAFLNPHVPELMPWELIDAILHQQDAHLTHLLKAGVSPNVGVGDPKKAVIARELDTAVEIAHGLQYPLHTAIWRNNANAVKLLLQHNASTSLTTLEGHSALEIALKSITMYQQSDDASLRRKLYIVRTILSAMPIQTIPSQEYVCKQIATLPQETQSRILELLSNRVTPRPCMSDEAPTTSLQQEESSFACGASILCCAWIGRVAMDLFCNRKALAAESEKKNQ